MKRVLFWSMIVCLLLVTLNTAKAETEPVVSTQIASRERSLMPIIISSNANDSIKKSAQILADYLQKISGATFEVKSGNGESGIVIGRAEEFPRFKSTFKAEDVAKPEAYPLRSDSQGVSLIGITDLGVEHAVWDFLHQFGYRYFFPGKHWEIIPHQTKLTIAVDKISKPDFLLRAYFVGYSSSKEGLWPGQVALWDQWRAANRMVQTDESDKAFSLNSGHALQDIYGLNKAAFEAHPEYHALVNGQRKPGPSDREKYCLSNAAVRQMGYWILVRCCNEFFDAFETKQIMLMNHHPQAVFKIGE